MSEELNLPPLPEPAMRELDRIGDAPYGGMVYTAKEMRDYALAAIESLTRDCNPDGKTILDFVYLWRDQSEDRALKAEAALTRQQVYVDAFYEIGKELLPMIKELAALKAREQPTASMDETRHQ